MESLNRETYISVDVETAGPNPSQYSLLTIGACTIGDNQQTFYVELKPVNKRMTRESFAIHRLSLKRLAEKGLAPDKAMANFESWVKSLLPAGEAPIFVSFNAPFDWMFVSDYFHRYLGRNPFGHTALDLKAFYMGLSGVPWKETSMSHVISRYLGDRQLTHHALRDALDQAEIFTRFLDEAGKKKEAQT